MTKFSVVTNSSGKLTQGAWEQALMWSLKMADEDKQKKWAGILFHCISYSVCAWKIYADKNVILELTASLI